jgi:hypothetical protein
MERAIVRQLGALLLARIDGKSPAEYITGGRQKRQARGLAKAILVGEIRTLGEVRQSLMTLSPAS